MIAERISNLKDFLAENKKSVLITLVLLVGMMALVYLVKEQQILKSRAVDSAPKRIPVDSRNPAEGSLVITDTPKLNIIINKSDFEKQLMRDIQGPSTKD